jgi:hypothetical protein
MIAVFATIVGGTKVDSTSDERIVSGIDTIPIATIVAMRNRKKQMLTREGVIKSVTTTDNQIGNRSECTFNLNRIRQARRPARCVQGVSSDGSSALKARMVERSSYEKGSSSSREAVFEELTL